MNLQPAVLARFTGLFALGALPLRAQTAPNTLAPHVAATDFSHARRLYYTPVDAGLRSFHCEVNFDWRQFIQRATNQPVPDDDTRLKYLQSTQLSVDDDLRGAGELHWVAPAPPPENTEDAIAKVRRGMQQIWAGFAQSWNGYFNGELVSLDAKATVEHTADGFHVAVRNGAELAEEQYDNELLLQRLHVSTPTQETTISPVFSPTPGGLLVSSLHSSYRQPPSAQPTELLMQLHYAPVGSFQVPSELLVSVGAASFNFHMVNCTVKTQLTSR